MKFDYDLYLKVREERKKMNLPVSELETKINFHPLMLFKIKDIEGDIYKLKNINKKFYLGNYFEVILENEKKEEIKTFLNIDSCADFVLQEEENFIRNYYFEINDNSNVKF